MHKFCYFYLHRPTPFSPTLIDSIFDPFKLFVRHMLSLSWIEMLFKIKREIFQFEMIILCSTASQGHLRWPNQAKTKKKNRTIDRNAERLREQKRKNTNQIASNVHTKSKIVDFSFVWIPKLKCEFTWKQKLFGHIQKKSSCVVCMWIWRFSYDTAFIWRCCFSWWKILQIIPKQNKSLNGSESGVSKTSDRIKSKKTTTKTSKNSSMLSTISFKRICEYGDNDYFYFQLFCATFSTNGRFRRLVGLELEPWVATCQTNLLQN